MKRTVLPIPFRLPQSFAKSGKRPAGATAPLLCALLGAMLAFGPISVSAQAQSSGANGTEAEANSLTKNVDFYQFIRSGRSIDSIKEEAEQEALYRTIGTFFFEDRFLQAPELLDRYVENRREDFIAGTKVLGIEQGVGTLNAEVQVAVDRGSLESDLSEKRFFYAPKRRPYFHISLEETLDGVPLEDSPGREAVSESLRELTARPTPYSISSPAPVIDVAADEDTLYEALIATRRQGIELIITGTVAGTLQREERLYYNDYAFYDAVANLKLIRVQDGTLVEEVSVSARSGDDDSRTAGRDAISRAAADATRDLLEKFFEDNMWEKIALDRADYRILAIDIDDSQLQAFINQLEALPLTADQRDEGATEAEAHVKSFYHGVAVINFYFGGDRAQLRRLLEESRYPRFNVEQFSEKGRIKLTRLAQ